MNPFEQIAATLTTRNAPAWNLEEVHLKGLSRTESIRQLLRAANRPVSAAEIAFDLELPSSCTVWLLMKYDMQKGRVILQDGKYHWSHAYDTAEAAAIRDAVKLLKSHGYKLKAPTA